MGTQDKSRSKLPIVIAAALAVLALLLVMWKPWQSESENSDQAEVADHTPGDRAPALEPRAKDEEPPAAPVGDERSLRLVAATVDEDAARFPNGAFSGRVVNWGNGKGVAAAEMVFSGPAGAVTVQSDSTGHFSFSPDEIGVHELTTINANGYLPYAPSLGTSAVSLAARPGVRVAGVIFYLTPAIKYNGKVVDGGDQPVAGAKVSLLTTGIGQMELMPIVDSFVSDANGEFTFSAPDGSILEARHRSKGKGRARLDSSAQISHGLIIKLVDLADGTATISGRVVSENGAPVSDVSIVCEGIRPKDAPLTDRLDERLARAGADGRFSVAVDPDRTYKLSALATGYAARYMPVEVGPAGSTAEVVVKLEPNAVIAGRVVDETGAPVPAFSVVVAKRVGVGQSVMATASVFNGDGRFEVDGLNAGDFVVSAAAYGFAVGEPVDTKAVVRKERTDSVPSVVITLPRGGTLVGRIIDAESKEPLANARVVAERSLGGGASAQPIVSSALTDQEGKFELAGLQPGKASVVASAYKHHSQIIGGMSVTSGATVGPVDVELTPTKDGEEPKLELAGLGAALAGTDDGLVIQRLIEGGGAIEAGLAVGDVIVAIDGAQVSTLGFAGAIQQIRGPVNTPLVISVRRVGGEAIVDLTAMRRKIRT